MESNIKPELLITSFPKAGRTWITFLISRYLQRTFNLREEELVYTEKISRLCDRISPITVSHEDNPHMKEPEELSKDKSQYSNKKVLLIARDPRDIIVSWYFHRKLRKEATERYRGTISEFIKERKGGFNSIVSYYNIWAMNREAPLNFLMVKYEQFRYL
jgi:hypothetical protein